jgi:hypothetical protein
MLVEVICAPTLGLITTLALVAPGGAVAYMVCLLSVAVSPGCTPFAGFPPVN